MLNVNPISIAELLRTTGRDLLKPARSHQKITPQRHLDGSTFSMFDTLCEKRLREGLSELTPSIEMTGEEEIALNPDRFRALMAHEGCWIADPIDGSGAFIRGEDTYGIMLALVYRGETVIGLIYSPETEIMIMAEKGGGCFLNDKAISLDHRPSTTADAHIAFACRNQDAHYESILSAGVPKPKTRHNSSHDYTRLLNGDVDATFYSEGIMRTGEGKVPPWDHCAGVLAVSEAGGYAALPYQSLGLPYDPTAYHDRLLVAANVSLFENIRRYVSERTPELCQPRPR